MSNPETISEDNGTKAEVKYWIGQRKRWQMIRAIRHLRYGVATPVELHYLREHKFPIPRAARRRTFLKSEGR